MKFRLIMPVTLLLILLQVLPLSVDGSDNVLVVQNGASPASRRIAEYYMTRRDIPSTNLVTVTVPDSSASSVNEAITRADYESKIEEPVRAHLAEKGLADRVQYIVLTKGIPIRLTHDKDNDSHGQSVDSMLAAIGMLSSNRVRLGDAGAPFINRYWRSTEPFSHAKFGGYLVTRLDGYTEADAKALVDRAMLRQSSPMHVLLDANGKSSPEEIAKQPKAILLPDGSFNKTCDVKYPDFDAEMAKTYEVISDRPGLIVKLEDTKEFVGSEHALTAYISWGSNAGPGFKTQTYQSLKFAPRSIAETAVSTSGRTFQRTTDGQSLMADLIAQGAAGAKCYVTEPFLHAMASPSVLLDMYTSGRNLAESFYAASRFVGWKDIVLGDPLCSLEVVREGD